MCSESPPSAQTQARRLCQPMIPAPIIPVLAADTPLKCSNAAWRGD